MGNLLSEAVVFCGAGDEDVLLADVDDVDDVEDWEDGFLTGRLPNEAKSFTMSAGAHGCGFPDSRPGGEQVSIVAIPFQHTVFTRRAPGFSR